MIVLVLNCGGSSVKYQIFDLEQDIVICKGMTERIGQGGSALTHSVVGRDKAEILHDMPDHGAALALILETVADPHIGAIRTISEIGAVGHRVVHAGERYNGSVLITDDVVDAVEQCAELAPLHNPPNLLGIRACRALMPDVPQVAVFDNAFHRDLPDHVRPYAIPYEYYQKYGVRRYGFHGVAFQSMTEQASAILGVPLEALRLVSLMLGSGTTANAFKHGRSVEVSTGFTPCEGLVQSTRCGDIDPAVVTWLMKKEGLSADEMDTILYKKSGWLGISGVSADMRDVKAAANSGSLRAKLAIDAFAHRARKYVGAYAATMGGVDALVFSGGIGEREAGIRASICEGLEFMGIEIDEAKNAAHVGRPGIISPDGAVAKVVVVMLDEESVIARDTYRIAAALSAQQGAPA